MAECVFCGIIAGTRPASFLYRDTHVAAFMDIQPVNLGHLLVIPVRHAPYLSDVTPGEAAAMMQLGQRAAAALRASQVRCEGINFFLADGEAAMQEVFHAHLHVFPRYAGDGFGLKFAPEYYTRRLPREDLDQLASTIGALLPPA